MSNFTRRTRNPETGEFEEAEWLDNYYSHRTYGVRFPSTDRVYRETARVWEFEEVEREVGDV